MSYYLDRDVLKKHILKGQFGIEKECLRVDSKGYLSQTPHPFPGNKKIDRDFSENQTELITEICESEHEAYKALQRLHRIVMKELQRKGKEPEYLWPFSNPPYVRSEEEIPVARFSRSRRSKELYRNYLAEKYGKRKMLYSGIHYNFSFSEILMRKEYQSRQILSFREFKSCIYLELAKRLIEYSWLIVYLTAASPVLDGSFYEKNRLGETVLSDYASPRCSEEGYWNNFVPVLDFTDIVSHVDSIQRYVDSGQLRAVSELYYPIRIKPQGENTLDNLKSRGADHVELRMFDLNPLSPVGIIEEDMNFLHCLIIYLMSLEETPLDEDQQRLAVANVRRAALYDPAAIYIAGASGDRESIAQAAGRVLDDMEAFFNAMGLPVPSSIEYQREKIRRPEKRYAAVIRSKFNEEYVERGMQLAKSYAEGFAASKISIT